jgi:probable F420-dependent oxidoreductase
MKFGTFLFQRFLFQTQGPSLAAIGRKAEELGFESLWIPEHILRPVTYKSRYPYSASGQMPSPPETPLHDPMLALAYVVGVTSKIRLATGIFVVPLRNPFATAKAVASLDVLSGGRFIFGVGIGWLAEEFAGVGMDFKDRARRTREYIALMKELWSKSEPVYHGRTVGIEGFRFEPKPVQRPHPPIVLGGHTEPSLKRAAQIGDGWYGFAEDLEQTRGIIARLREHERAANRVAPLEITVSPRLGGQLTLEQARDLAAMGVSRIILAGGPGTRDALATMEHYQQNLLSKF